MTTIFLAWPDLMYDAIPSRVRDWSRSPLPFARGSMVVDEVKFAAIKSKSEI